MISSAVVNRDTIMSGNLKHEFCNNCWTSELFSRLLSQLVHSFVYGLLYRRFISHCKEFMKAQNYLGIKFISGKGENKSECYQPVGFLEVFRPLT